MVFLFSYNNYKSIVFYKNIQIVHNKFFQKGTTINFVKKASIKKNNEQIIKLEQKNEKEAIE